MYIAVVACDMSIDVPYIRPRVCDPASDWSLVVNPCIFSLVACMVACVCFYCIYRIVYRLFYPQRVRSCKRLVACHRVPCSFTGCLQGRLPYCFVAQCQLMRVTVQVTGRLLLISIQMYWSLAWSPKQSGVCWKSHPGRVRYSFIKRPEQAPGHLLYF